MLRQKDFAADCLVSYGTISVFASVYYEHRDLLHMHRHLYANLLKAVYNAGEHGGRLSNI
eukprot:10273-Heterococcus_DN1.PRE.1